METYVEDKCIVTVDGKSFEAGGAVVNSARALLYAYSAENKVGNWHGDEKMPAYYGKVWRSNMGDTRQPVTF